MSETTSPALPPRTVNDGYAFFGDLRDIAPEDNGYQNFFVLATAGRNAERFSVKVGSEQHAALSKIEIGTRVRVTVTPPYVAKSPRTGNYYQAGLRVQSVSAGR